MSNVIGSLLIKVGGSFINKIRTERNFNAIFKNAANNTLSLDYDPQSELYSQLQVIFSEENINKVITDAKNKKGMDIINTVRADLDGVFGSYITEKVERKRCIDICIEQIKMGIKYESPDLYEQIFLDDFKEDFDKKHNELINGQKIIINKLDKPKDPYQYGKKLEQVETYLKENTVCALDFNFFDFNEKGTDEKIRQSIIEGQQVYLQGRSKEELLYHVLWVIKKMGAEYQSKTLVVETSENWQKLSNLAKNLILIPNFYANEIGVITGNVNIFLYINPSAEIKSKIIKVPNRIKSNLSDKLQVYLKDADQVYRLIEQTSGLYPALKRKLFKKQLAVPTWTNSDVNLLIPALLAGSWAYFPGDKAVVALLAGKSYEEYERLLLSVEYIEEPFVLKTSSRFVGTVCIVSDLSNAWNYLINYITEEDWAKFADVTVKVLLDIGFKPNYVPKNGVTDTMMLVHNDFSLTLKKGIARSLIYLNMIGGLHYQPLVKKIIEEVFSKIDSEEQWINLAEVFNLLIEAAPDSCLDELEKVVSDDDNLFWCLFHDYDNRYTYILFALEKLLFMNSFVPRTVDILFRLALKKIEYKLVNKPEASLHSVFCGWFQEIDVTIDDKIKLLNKSLEEYPEVAWTILKHVLPTGYGSYDPLNKPEIVLYDAQQKVKTNKDIRDTYTAYFKLAINFAGTDLKKWSDLYGSCLFIKYGLKDQAFKGVLAALASSCNDSDKYTFSETLRNCIYNGRCRPKDSWLNDVELDDLENSIFKQITYTNLVYGYLYLFKSDIHDLHPSIDANNLHEDYRKLQTLKYERCKAAIKELCTKGLLATDLSIIDFAQLAHDDAELGKIFNELHIVKDRISFIVSLYENRLGNTLQMFVWDIYNNEGIETIKNLANNDAIKLDELRFLILKVIPIDISWIDYLSGLGEDFNSYYWRFITPFVDRSNIELLNLVFDKLIIYKNFYYAFVIACGNTDLSVASYLRLLQAVKAEIDSIKISSEAYHIFTVFKKLYNLVNFGDDKYTDLIVDLEIEFIDVFFEKKPQFLYKKLCTDPKFCAGLLKHIYKMETTGNEDEVELSESEKKLATKMYDVFLYVKFCPAISDTGKFEKTELKKWCVNYVEAVTANKQLSIGLSYLGRFLASSPKGEDGLFPHETVREAVEQYCSYESFKNGFVVEIFNLRGVHAVNAGFEEKSIANDYQEYADALRIPFPKTSALLQKISDEYSRQSIDERQVAEHEY